MRQDIVITPYEGMYRGQMVSVWERSVRATHDFVHLDDIEYFKSIVVNIDFATFDVHCAIDAGGKVVGFIGVLHQQVEMLFLDPEVIGYGVGKQLMKFAIRELKATMVDVNEQNINAVKFYSKLGFQVYDRTEKDPEGKDYPILKMKLEMATQ